MQVDRGDGAIFLKPPRAIRPGEDMATYLLCDRGFVPTITVVVPRELAARVRYHENLRPAEDTDFAIRLALAGYASRCWKSPARCGRTNCRSRAAPPPARAAALGTWLQQMRPQITVPRLSWRARLGLCQAGARASIRCRRLALYLNAVLRGCYRPSPGVRDVPADIPGCRASYRRLADHAISWLRIGLREPNAKNPARQAGTGVISRRRRDCWRPAPARWPFPPRRRTCAASKRLPPPRAWSSARAAASYELKDADFTPLLLRDAGQLVPEYEMKRARAGDRARRRMILPGWTRCSPSPRGTA